MVKKLLLGLMLAAASSAYADFTVQLDAGRLRIDAANPMPVGGLLVLVAAGGDNSFSNSLAGGQYVSGNDILLGVANAVTPNGAGPFNTSGGLDETNNVFNVSSTTFPSLQVGDLLALRWFPSITYASFLTGSTPTPGTQFGTYNPLAAGNATNNPDGGNFWAVPAAGGLIDLNFFTTDSSGGGTQLPSTGYANFTVVAAVPEPSAIMLLGIAAIGMGAVYGRRVRR
jgi:hypothetical protein